MGKRQLTLEIEILSGPLDGHIVQLEEKTDWGIKGDGPLSFPWDKELGDPQARFFPENDDWWIESLPSAKRNTRFIHQKDPIKEKTKLKKGEILKACGTFLLIKKIE